MIHLGQTTIESGKAALERLLLEFPEDRTEWNEAEVRFNFIDRLLVECLGWPRNLIKVEHHMDGEFADYITGQPFSAVWEAKKEGKYFELPANPAARTIESLGSITALSKEARAALQQVQRYCASRGVPYAVVCNGPQLIAFLAIRIGEPPLEGKAFVLNGYAAMSDKFPDLWQYLSPEGVAEKRLTRLLTLGVTTGVPAKLSSLILRFPEYRYKTSLQSNLRTVAELLVEDIVNTPDVEEQFYKECYCDSGALSRYSLISKQILSARYAALFNVTDPLPKVDKISSKKGGATITPEILAEAMGGRPIVLIGDVGVGKSSFLKNLIYVKARAEFDNSIYIYVDLGTQAALAEDLRKALLTQIESQLYQRYSIDLYENNFVRGVYDLELQRFSRGIHGSLAKHNQDEYRTKQLEFLEEKINEKSEHTRLSVRHLVKGRQKQVVIIIDNADQRPFDVQQEAFVIAQNIAREWDAIVFVSVRPQTFHQSKRAGAFSAYPQRIFTILPPRVDRVIERRLRFALHIAEGKISFEKLQGIRLNLNNISHFLRVMLDSLNRSKQLSEFLENITGGNIRAVIELVTKFIGSPNVDARKIIHFVAKGETYTIPVHEFSKAALLGEYSHYNPESSLAMNIFDVSTADRKEHFLVPLLLAYLGFEGPHRGRDGFVDIKRIYEELQDRGFLVSQIDSALRRATNKRLLETTERVTFEEDSAGLFGTLPSAFRATSTGVYHLRRWSPSFAYLNAMSIDTPIFDDAVFKGMGEVTGSFDIRERLQRTLLFRRYLTAIWHEASLSPTYFDWVALVPTGQAEFDSVERAIEKMQTRKGGVVGP